MVGDNLAIIGSEPKYNELLNGWHMPTKFFLPESH